MKIKWSVRMTAVHDAKAAGEFEIADEATDEEIEQAVREEISYHVEWRWERVT